MKVMRISRGLFAVMAVVWGLVVSAALITQHKALRQAVTSTPAMDPLEIQELNQRVTQLEIPRLAPPTVSPAELTALRVTLEGQLTTIALAVEERAPLQALLELEQQVQRLESLPPPPGIATAEPSPLPKPAAPAAVHPPFRLIGLELRGGERFLALTPNGATSLEQTQLLRIGDSHERWKLVALEASTAVFRVGRTVRRLALP